MCDECGKVGAEPYDGWLRTEHSDLFPSFGRVSTTFDSCSFACLAKACQSEMEKETARA
jgi:hypothetical protein